MIDANYLGKNISIHLTRLIRKELLIKIKKSKDQEISKTGLLEFEKTLKNQKIFFNYFFTDWQKNPKKFPLYK